MKRLCRRSFWKGLPKCRRAGREIPAQQEQTNRSSYLTLAAVREFRIKRGCLISAEELLYRQHDAKCLNLNLLNRRTVSRQRPKMTAGLPCQTLKLALLLWFAWLGAKTGITCVGSLTTSSATNTKVERCH